MSAATDTAISPDQQHLDVIRDVKFQPIFIIGDHRSGTTLLHRLLVDTGCFNYVSAYHVIRYGEVLTNHLAGKTPEAMQSVMDQFRERGLKNRIIDETPAVPEAPIEYGFILDTPNNRRPRITAETLPKFQELAKKIQFVGDPDKPLLLKNPWDVICFMDIKKYFPEAKFVFIHRHPVAIMNSQMRAIRTLLEKRSEFAVLIQPSYKAMWEKPLQLQLRLARFMDKPPLSLWLRLLAHHTIKACNYFLAHYQSLPASDYISVQYEQLCREPDATMDRITTFLGVHPPPEIRYAEKIKPREPKVLPEILHRFRAIRSSLKKYLEFEGYTMDPK